MKLYRKKLSGLEELHREKIKLMYQKRHLDKLHEVRSADRGNSRPADSGLLHTILNIAGDGNATSSAFQIGNMLIKQLGKKRRKGQAAMHANVEFPKPKSTTRKLVEDIFWSYVLGKAIRFSVGMLKDSLNKKKRHF